MGGFFGVVSKEPCNLDTFYGTDYHSHLGTRRGGMTTQGKGLAQRRIHDIAQKGFRPQLEYFAVQNEGNMSIGVISDLEDQPIFNSRHGSFYLVHVGRVSNLNDIAQRAEESGCHFTEPPVDETIHYNPVEVVGHLIGKGKNISDGIDIAQHEIEGSSSVLVMTKDGIYAARDRLGRTPVIIGKKDGAYAATMETTAFFNQDFEPVMELRPGQKVLMTPNSLEVLNEGFDEMQVCAFLWIYYGYPTSKYEGVNVEMMRNNSGERQAAAEMKRLGIGPGEFPFDIVAGIPDSGTGYAIGYANKSSVRYGRPFIKYTPSWPRSFMPQEQRLRDLVAKKKLVPVVELIEGRRILACEDSIVRGTQLREFIHQMLDRYHAAEIHMRPACPPLTHACRFLNFSRSSSEQVLAARRSIAAVNREDGKNHDVNDFTDESSELYERMVGHTRKELGLTSLVYQKMDDLIASIGLPREKLCRGCWRDCSKCGK